MHVIHDARTLEGERGETISLFALHGPATGVTTSGLLYPLTQETLLPGSSRGCSNAFIDGRAEIALANGVLLAVRPGSVAAENGLSSPPTPQQSG